jgi:enoyl-CoA hydratase
VTYDTLTVETDGAVATITLNRPNKRNAISLAMRAELEDALHGLSVGDAVRVIRLRGAGRAFCSGYDLGPMEYSAVADLPAASRAGTAAADLGQSRFAIDREVQRESAERWMRLFNYRKPIIAQVHGYCLAGALDLLAICDVTFAAAGAKFGHPPARMHGIPVLLGMLPVKIGASRTKEFLFTGDNIDAREAHRLGLVNRVLPDEELDAVTVAYCQRVAMAPLDTLTVHKQATNSWLEVMGARTAAIQSADWDAMAHQAPAVEEFEARAREDGLRAALDWRDGCYH